MIKRFFRPRKPSRIFLSFGNCVALFKKLENFQRKLSYLYFTPVFPFVPRVGKREEKEITPFYSIFLKMNIPKRGIINLLKTISVVQKVNRPSEKSLFFYNLTNIFFEKMLVEYFSRLMRIPLSLERSRILRSTLIHKKTGYTITDRLYKTKLFKTSIKSYSLVHRVNQFLGIPRDMTSIIEKSSTSFTVFSRALPSVIYKIHQFARTDKLLKSSILKTKEFHKEAFLPIFITQFRTSLREKILENRNISLLEIHKRLFFYNQRQIARAAYYIKTLQEKIGYARTSRVLSKTSVIYTTMRKNVSRVLIEKKPYIKNLREARSKISFFRIPERISSIIKVREKALYLTTERVTPYTTYLTSSIREIQRRGKPYIIYEYPKSPAIINVSIPAVATSKSSTRNVNYTFRNVINVTVNVASLESDRDIRELGRKIAKILTEEARKYGVEL